MADTSVVLPQRVQIRLRGVRFETTVDVLSTYSGTYRRFFELWAVDSGAMRSSVLSLIQQNGSPSESAAATSHSDGVLSSSSTIDAGTVAAVTSILSKAFTEDCIPADAPFIPPIREATLLPHAPNCKVPPADTTGYYWFWDFSVLKAEDPTSSTEPATATTTSKFGAVTAPKNELQPEFAGMIFVFLRKTNLQRLAQQQQTAGAPVPEPKPVKFSARWDEMPYDQQRSMCDIVNVLDIAILKDMGYGHPTADPATADGADGAAPDGDGDDHTMVDKALEYLAIQRNIHHPQGTTKPHPSTEDDTLEMPASGCAKCGTSGHPTESCPY